MGSGREEGELASRITPSPASPTHLGQEGGAVVPGDLDAVATRLEG